MTDSCVERSGWGNGDPVRQWPVPPGLLLGAALALAGLLLATVLTHDPQDTATLRSETPRSVTPRAQPQPPSPVPALWPTPRIVRMVRGSVRIGGSVALRSDTGTDTATLDSAARTLREAGVHQLRHGDQPQQDELLLTIASKPPGTPDQASTVLRTRWRDTYPASRLTPLRTLVRRATGNNITFVHTLSPDPTVHYRTLAQCCPLQGGGVGHPRHSGPEGRGIRARIALSGNGVVRPTAGRTGSNACGGPRKASSRKGAGKGL